MTFRERFEQEPNWAKRVITMEKGNIIQDQQQGVYSVGIG